MTSRTQSIPTLLLGHLISPPHFPSNHTAFLLSSSVFFRSGTRGCCSQGSSPQHGPYTTHKDEMRTIATISLSHTAPQNSASGKNPGRLHLHNSGFTLKLDFEAQHKNKQPALSDARQRSLLEATQHKQSSTATQPPAWPAPQGHLTRHTGPPTGMAETRGLRRSPEPMPHGPVSAATILSQVRCPPRCPDGGHRLQDTALAPLAWAGDPPGWKGPFAPLRTTLPSALLGATAAR